MSGAIGRPRRKVVCQQNQILLLVVKLFSLTPLGNGGRTCLSHVFFCPFLHLLFDLIHGIISLTNTKTKKNRRSFQLIFVFGIFNFHEFSFPTKEK